MPDYHSAARIEDIPEGEGRVVKVSGKEIALFKVNGEIYALDNCCPHLGGPLGEGIVSGCEVICPWHAWTFDVRTGAYTYNSELAVQKFDVLVEGGEIKIAL